MLPLAEEPQQRLPHRANQPLAVALRKAHQTDI